MTKVSFQPELHDPCVRTRACVKDKRLSTIPFATTTNTTPHLHELAS